MFPPPPQSSCAFARSLRPGAWPPTCKRWRCRCRASVLDIRLPVSPAGLRRTAKSTGLPTINPSSLGGTRSPGSRRSGPGIRPFFLWRRARLSFVRSRIRSGDLHLSRVTLYQLSYRDESCRDERAPWLPLPFGEQNATRLMPFSLAGIQDRTSRLRDTVASSLRLWPCHPALACKARTSGYPSSLPCRCFAEGAFSAAPLVGQVHRWPP